MNALEEFRELIEEHWPHSNPYWREGDMQFAPVIDAIADRIEAEWMELPRDKDGEVIHVGDIMRDRDGNEIAVDKVCSGGFFVGTRNGCFLIADGFTHVKPDTPESIASDIDNGRCTGQQAVERFKALGGAE